MNEELLRRLVEAFETIVQMYQKNDERSSRRMVLEQKTNDEAMEIARQQQAMLLQIAENQALHIKRCEESHKRAEDLARQRVQETFQ